MDMVKSLDLVYKYHTEDETGVITFDALNGISMDVKHGDFIAVLGRNGSGKSTFAKLINSLLIPTEGSLWINGMDSSDESLILKIRQSAGMVFQNPDNQIVAAIVEEDVAFGPENMGIAPEKIRKRVDDSLSAVDMKDYAKASPAHLSGGQKQRIAIAGILAMLPECIVLDEPTAMLDPKGRKEVLETISALNREKGITIILITHYMDEAALADKIFVMESGKIVMQGTPKEIFPQVDSLKALGLDVPQVTEVAHELIKSGISLPKDVLTVEEMADEICRLVLKT